MAVDVNKIRSLAAKGRTVIQIAAELGCTSATIYTHGHRHGIKFATLNRTKVDHAELFRRFRLGHSQTEIARGFKCSVATVNHHLRRAGWIGTREAKPPIRRKAYSRAEDARIRKTIAALAATLNRTPDQVVDHARYLFARVPRVKGK